MPFSIPRGLFLFVWPLHSASYYGSNWPQQEQIFGRGSFPSTSRPSLQHPTTGTQWTTFLLTSDERDEFGLFFSPSSLRDLLQNSYLFAFYTFKAIFRHQITYLGFTEVTLPAARDAESNLEPNLIRSTSAQPPQQPSLDTFSKPASLPGFIIQPLLPREQITWHWILSFETYFIPSSADHPG